MLSFKCTIEEKDYKLKLFSKLVSTKYICKTIEENFKRL